MITEILPSCARVCGAFGVERALYKIVNFNT